jgi:deoxyribodipyrimidine photolyase
MHRIILWFRNDLRIHDNYIIKTAYDTVAKNRVLQQQKKS